LSVGANNRGKHEAVNRVLGTHEVLPLSRQIGEKALKLVEHNAGSICQMPS